MISFRFGIYLAIIFFGVIIALWKQSKLNQAQKYLGILLAFTLISEIVSRYLVLKIRNSNPGYHFYSPAEAILLGIILWYISKNSIHKKLIGSLFALVFVFSIINSFFIQTLYEFNSNADLLKMPIAVLSVFLILTERTQYLVKGERIVSPNLVILISIFWFNTMSLLFMIFHNYFIKSGISVKVIGNIYYMSNIIYYLLFATSLLLVEKKKNESFSQ